MQNPTNKQLAKIFTILYIVVAWLAIIPLIIGVLTLKKIEQEMSKDDKLLYGILNIVFGNLISGVCLLLDEKK
ncbi:Uncharacterised protein [Mycoplasmopsis bovigenitalium]|uniref:Uncharacterized protein n=2 Tax=Mycoplasmopsis bovigenitalium TaxID=2112 RepID=N9TSA3_9BACT|nr:hypothetical protein [Mycoplasmopsis bovigenitalium]ENY68965.1 Hypothetical protein MBVG_6340 [Mycoplasmopsis bovigenitalium 51080]VEU60961.1 Uncharacterised protein [Mycoplasmopsis bovigenitalium]